MTQLVEFAKQEFRLGKRGKDGKSLRETLAVVEKMTGRMPEEGINPMEFPDVLWDLWHQFLALNATRPPGTGGASAITESEIRAYSLNRRVRFERWQLDAIRALDEVALSSGDSA